MSRPATTPGLPVLLAALAVPLLASCGHRDSAATSSPVHQRSLSDFQYSREDVQLGEEGSAAAGMIVGGKRSSFEGKRQVAFGGELDRKIYSAPTYQAGQWSGSKTYQAKAYTGNTDGSRFQTDSRYNAQGAREASRQSNYDGRTVDTGAYDTGGAREGERPLLDSTESVDASRRYDQPRIIPYRDYQRMTIEETNHILGRD